MSQALTTNQKALKINLDPNIYGTFAEIGAGQDVAGHFFKAGAASGTVAKTISAYDMVFSDSIYGKEKSGRYVCESRLKKMLGYEYDLLLERLEGVRENCSFFSFANTVSARNFHGTNVAHGWLGIRYRKNCGEVYSDIILHVKMHDNSGVLQQKAIGILGVNMIYTAYYHSGGVESFVDALMEGLSRDRIEIDMIQTAGPLLDHLDDRLVNLQLVEKGITDAVLFGKDGYVELASDSLYKKNVMVARGSYRPPTLVNVDMLNVGMKNFAQTIGCGEDDIVSLAEITLSNLKAEGEMTHDDFLARVDLINTIDQKVLITNFAHYYRLSNYLTGFRAKNIAIVLGAYNFQQIFDDTGSGKLEAMGKLFQENVKVYLYPYREEAQTDELITLNNLPLKKKDKHLLDHILSLGQVINLEGFDNNLLHIYSRKVLNMIKSGEDGWEQYVPKKIADAINERCLFGHPCHVKEKN